MKKWQDIEGWLTEDEGIGLQKYCKGKKVLELGSYLGRSTVCISESNPLYLTSVDTFDGRATTDIKPTLDSFKRNIEGIKNHEYFVMTTQEFFDTEVMLGFDTIFVDADHSYGGCKSDCLNALGGYLKKGGYLILHDAVFNGCIGGAQPWEGVNLFYKELLAMDNIRDIERFGRIAVVQLIQ